MLTKDQLTALAIASLVVTAVVVGAVVYYALRLRGSGFIKTIGLEVYADPAATVPVTSIDWGEIAPGNFSQAQLYLKNPSNYAINLTLTAENWQPPTCPTYMALIWDYNDAPLEPHEVRAVKLTLLVFDDITGIYDFSVIVVITAKG